MNYTSVGINRHKVLNGLAQEDPTYENYLRLAEWIFTGKVSLSDLLNEEESRKRMKEIDELRARGERTPYEAEFKKPKAKGNPNLSPRKIVLEVTNLETKEKIIYKSMKSFCEINNVSRSYIKNRFKKAQGNKILYNRLIIKKLDTNTSETEIQAQRVYLNPNIDINKHKTPWTEEEKAFIAQNRPDKTWKYIGACLGRSAESCSNVMRNMKNKGELEYYKNLDISDRLEIGA